VTTGFLIGFLATTPLTQPQAPSREINDFLFGLIAATMIGWPMVMAAAAIPAILAIAYAERYDKGSLSFFLVTGIVAALLPTTPGLIADAIGNGRYGLSAYMIFVLGCAGMAAGIIYWAMAGRNGGNRHHTAPPGGPR
jgi:hypothetical protein